jgi:hypothetical protein
VPEIDRLRVPKGRSAVVVPALLGVVLLALGLILWNPGPRDPGAFRVREWEALGGSATGTGLSANVLLTEHPSLCLDRSGRPIVAWRDDSSGNTEIYLRRWEAPAWVEIGGSATGGGVSRLPGTSQKPSLALDAEGHPVVAWFEDLEGSTEIYLRRWDGKAWVDLGGSGLGGGLSREMSRSVDPVVALDARGNPVVVWSCIPRPEPGFPINREIYLRRWNGQDWEQLGGSASGGGISRNPGDSTRPSIVVDRAGNPTVLWEDASSGESEIRVCRWSGSAWENLGAWPGQRGGLQLDSEGHPVVVWDRHGPGNFEVYLRRWDGRSWVELGNSGSGAGISRTAEASIQPTLALDAVGCPLVAWQEGVKPSNWKIYLRRWDGWAWIPLGESDSGGGLSDGRATACDPKLALDPAGRPYVAWDDGTSAAHSIYLKRWSGPRDRTAGKE